VENIIQPQQESSALPFLLCDQDDGAEDLFLKASPPTACSGHCRPSRSSGSAAKHEAKIAKYAQAAF